MTKFLSIVSGNGGTGKTVTAINLALALKNLGRDVILLDANLSSPHIALYLGMNTPITLNDVLLGKEHLNKATYYHPSSLKVIPANIYALEENYPNQVSSVLLDLVGKAEVVIIDSAPGFSKETISAITSSDETIIVANPTLASATSSYKMANVIKNMGSTMAGTILNRATKGKLELHQKTFKDFLKTHIIATIPEDKNIKKSISLKHPIVYSHPRSPAAIEFKKAAELLNV